MQRDRRTLARVAVALLVVALLLPAGVSALTYSPTDFEPGTIDEPADNPTVVGIQGFHFQGRSAAKKPARLASIDGDGSFGWQFAGDRVNGVWFYDVDPLPNGNLLAVSTTPGGTVVFELDPETREPVWTERLDMEDTHDVDLLPNGDLLVANMRERDGDEPPDDRVVVYNRSTDAITWEWTFRNHYPESTDGGYNDDWTHVNDADATGDGRILVSPRNFDQVILINRSTKAIEMQLGDDEDYDVLNEQHNPDWLVSEAGRPTILVADSENNRVIEYERRCTGDPMTTAPPGCSWNATWTVGVEGNLNWPRDADRLPNGNTLITDSLNHRVIEVTPQGEIVWEYYATWGPYDAERLGAANRSAPGTGGSAAGPTMADADATGEYALSGSANDPPVPSEASGPSVLLADAGLDGLARTWSHVVPWVKPVWASGWEFVAAVTGLLVGLGWAGAEVAQNRDRLAARLGADR